MNNADLRSHFKAILRHPLADLVVSLLILVSVGLTLAELTLPPNSPQLQLLDSINRWVTVIFAIELGLRSLSSSSQRRFWKEYKLDLISLLPIVPGLQPFRVIVGLRLLRIVRLLRLINRSTRSLPYFLRRGFPEYAIIIELLLLTILFGSVAMLAFERHENPEITSLEDAFWSSVYSLFAGEPIPDLPTSLGGRLLTVLLIFMNVTLFVMFTGTVSAFMVERLRKQEAEMDFDELSGHTIICGWNRKAEIIVREYQAAGKNQKAPIVAIAFIDPDHTIIEPHLRSVVRFINDDFTKVTVLEKACIRRANTCIILADKSHGRSEQDADARTILAALTAEKLNPNVYTCAELINREYASHLELGHVNAYVVSEEHSAFLLAQAALNHGLMRLFTELLTHQRGNQFYRFPIQEEWVGQTFFDVLILLKQNYNAILIAIDRPGAEIQINPANYVFQEGDRAIAIAPEEIDI
ncbi:MAG: potassium channel family protein [Limnospira sp.]